MACASCEERRRRALEAAKQLKEKAREIRDRLRKQPPKPK